MGAADRSAADRGRLDRDRRGTASPGSGTGPAAATGPGPGRRRDPARAGQRPHASRTELDGRPRAARRLDGRMDSRADPSTLHGPAARGEAASDAIERAAIGMRDTGTVLVGDISNTLTTAGAFAAAGLGGVVFHELLGFNAVDPAAMVRDAWAAVDAVGFRRPGRRVVRRRARAVLDVPAARRRDRAPPPRRPRWRFIWANRRRRSSSSARPRAVSRSARGARRLDRRGSRRDCDPVEYSAPPRLPAARHCWPSTACISRRRAGPAGRGWRGRRHLSAQQRLGRRRPAARVAFLRRGPGGGDRHRQPGVDATLNLFDELAELRRIAPDVAASALLDSATRQGARALGFGPTSARSRPGSGRRSSRSRFLTASRMWKNTWSAACRRRRSAASPERHARPAPHLRVVRPVQPLGLRAAVCARRRAAGTRATWTSRGPG